MTPLNNGRLSDDVWRSKVEQMVVDEHKWAREQIEGEREDREKLAGELKQYYVTKEALGYQLSNFKIVTDKLDKALDWFLWFVVAGFLGAVARIVYVNAK